MVVLIFALLSLPTLWELMSLGVFGLGVFCYAIKELQSHGKLRGQKDDSSFWGEKSHLRKWVYLHYNQANPSSPIKQERFPLSSTALVWLTDGMHLMQFFFIKLVVLAVVMYEPLYSWYWDVGIYLVVWYGIFNLIYKIFSK